MKYIIISSLLLCGCNNLNVTPEPTKDYSKTDSVIANSEKNLTIVNSTNQKSDSMVKGKINHTVNKINKLESENKLLKNENNELKNQINDNNDIGDPYIIRTISN